MKKFLTQEFTLGSLTLPMWVPVGIGIVVLVILMATTGEPAGIDSDWSGGA